MSQHDLFGPLPKKSAADRRSVELVLEVDGETHEAWLLSKKGGKARWIPKSQVKRGEGRDENVWTVPAWAARERGWL